MRKFFTYELASISAFGISLIDINQILQCIILVIGVWASFKALKWSEGKEKDKQPPIL
jgi:hypothetical protein